MDEAADAPEHHNSDLADPTLHCLHCGYQLRGLPRSSRCPECGSSIELSKGLLECPERLVEAWSLLRWSYLSIFGLLILLYPGGPVPFALLACAGAALRIAAIVRFRNAWLLAVHDTAPRVNWLTYLTGVEVAVLLALLYAVAGQHNIMHDYLGVLVWLWLIIVSATLLPAVGLGRLFSRRLDHPLIDLQLGNARKCIIAAFIVSLAACSALAAARGVDLALVWVGLTVHALVAALAFGHAIAACAHLSTAVGEAPTKQRPAPASRPPHA